MPTDFTPNPNDPDRWLRCARCGTPVQSIEVREEPGRVRHDGQTIPTNRYEILVECHGAGESNRVDLSYDSGIRNPLRVPPEWRHGQAFRGTPVSSSLSAACNAILEEIIRDTVSRFTGEKISPELLAAMGATATLAARDPDHHQPALSRVRITYRPTPGNPGAVGAHVDLEDREYQRETLGQWRDHPPDNRNRVRIRDHFADSLLYGRRAGKTHAHDEASRARRNAMTPAQWGMARSEDGVCRICQADRTMWCDEVVHVQAVAAGVDVYGLNNPKHPAMLASKRDELLAHDCRAHVDALEAHRVQLRETVIMLAAILDYVIEPLRREHEKRMLIDIACATLVAILRVVSRAWACSPTLLELDLEPFNPNPEALSPVACDETELRFALLEIEPQQKG